MIKKVAVVLLALIAVLAGVVAMQPSQYSVERSAEIHAPTSVLVAQVASARAWENWSPWHRIDPAMKLTYEGPESGPGSAYVWEGNSDVGKGRMTITGVTDNRVETQLDFLEPMQATSRGSFTFEPTGEATRVTWRMEGENNFVGKAVSLMMSMDSMVGTQFEKGLALLAEVAESSAVPVPPTESAPAPGAETAPDAETAPAPSGG